MNYISYEDLGDSCKLLANLLIKQKVVNRIADREKGTTMIEPVVKTYAEVKAVSEVINQQFAELNKAFVSKKISIGEYRARLTALRDLLIKHKRHGKYLDSISIQNEIKVYFPK